MTSSPPGRPGQPGGAGRHGQAGGHAGRHGEGGEGGETARRGGGGAATPGSGRHLVVELDPRTAVAVAVGVVVLWQLLDLAGATRSTLAALATGVLLGFGLDPVVVAIRRRLGCGRTTAVALVGTAFAVVVGLLLAVMAPRAIRQAEQFGRELPATVRQLDDLPLVGGRLRDAGVTDAVDRWVDDLPSHLDAETLAGLTAAALNGAATFVTVGVVAIAMLLDGEVLVRRVRRLLPRDHRARADWVGRTAYRVIARYFAGSLLVAVLAGLYVLAVGLALGVPLVPLVALWVTVTNLVPQIGGFLGGSAFTLLALTAGLGVGLAALALFLVWQNMENHVLQPAIVGEAVDLSPPTTILAVLVGAAAAGVPGALIATPLAGTVKGLYLGLWGVEPAERSGAARRRLRDRLRRRRPQPEDEVPRAGSRSSRGMSRQSRSSS